jgi:hypothetical protein
MVQIRGKYFNGVLTLQEPVSSEKPLEIIVIFPDVEATEEKPVDLADFDFAKAQMLLKVLSPKPFWKNVSRADENLP